MMFQTFAATDIEIHVASGVLFRLFGFPITNSLFTGFLSLIVLLIGFGYVVYMLKHGRYNRFIGLVQWAFEGMVGQINSVIPDKVLARKITPLALTIFFYMMVSYWMSVLPGLDSIKYNDTPVLRALPADLNFTFAVSLIVFVTVQFHAIRSLGAIGNLGRYFRNPLKDPIAAFEGVLEFIGEFSRYAALAVRMFGNCFAGEILLVIIGVLTSYVSVLALPLFMGFELFIGFVQAYVFFILTVIFTGLAVEHHGSEPDHSSSHASKKVDVPA